MSFHLYNTLTRKVQAFEPLVPGKVGFYGCGPTVYNYAHIGNLRAYIIHDVLCRALKRAGFAVTHVMNITDVGHLSGDDDNGEDKMVKSAEERGKSVLEVAGFYTAAFFRDTGLLNIQRPDVVCKATEHIDDMIALIKRIEDNGCTYSAGGNLYFDVSKFVHYGDLAQLRLGELKAGARTGVDENKRNPQDFVLWFTKSKFENQALVWDSPWGRGYPGWHIECSAMSIKYLGEQFDIHAGGIDHISIHHTNEIAQSEAATGIHPWVQYWIHNEFLVLNRAKMSKSQGSFLTLQSLIDLGYEPLDYRYFLLGAHYRSQLQFSNESMDGARNARKALQDRIAAIAAIVEKDVPLEDLVPEALGTSTIRTYPEGREGAYLAAFDRALEDDLSTPRALAELWGLVRDTQAQAVETLKAVFAMDAVLGLDIRGTLAADTKKQGVGTQEIEALIAERTAAKKNKDYKRADAIRQQLKEGGIILEDTVAGGARPQCCKLPYCRRVCTGGALRNASTRGRMSRLPQTIHGLADSRIVG
ncbi:cysteine--tRNA ligase [Breznakiellaceae bacterium SP9]